MPDDTLPRSRRATLLIGIGTAVAAVAALLAWGFASPVGSSPDDDFHLASIWCGGASLSQTCTEGDEPDERTVPSDLVGAAVCHAYQPASSGACQGDDFGTEPDEVISTDRGSFSGLYPPVYYAAMSVFAGPNIEVSVATIRIVNGVFFVAVVALLLILVPARLRTPALLGLTITAVPLAMFVIPSTNPSGWAVLSAATLWVSLVAYFEATGRRKVALGAFSVMAAVLGAGARSDAAIYACLAVVVAVVLTFRHRRAWYLSAILPLAVVVMSAAFFLAAGQSSVGSSGFAGEGVEPSDLDPISLLVSNTVLIPSLWAGIFGLGGWALGWLDTVTPGTTGLLAFFVFAGLAYRAIRTRVPRKWLVVLGVLGALWILPTYILVRSGTFVGAYVQPRYILPLVVMLAGLLLLGVSGRAALSRVQAIVVVGALSIANALALHFVIRRYVTGTDQGGLNLDTGSEWWWPGLTLSPMTVWMLGSVFFAIAMTGVVLFVRSQRQDRGAPVGIEFTSPSST